MGAGIFGEIVGAHHKAGKPRFRIERRRGDVADIEHGERRFHHRPDTDMRIGAHIDEPGREVLQLARR